MPPFMIIITLYNHDDRVTENFIHYVGLNLDYNHTKQFVAIIATVPFAIIWFVLIGFCIRLIDNKILSRKPKR
jgi:arginine exporter protein ArgO